ncbi:helix-turn-helix domain-containing protein [Yinghuangia sp. ASG 101]|uniref:helix-turn-helix domain-containing protein n=1 Tax=Yinghuangia sp. ASG 101 TaxID=2896848 RepID=UPI001E32C566|nr:helix-turn-helix domain-containing protein [Yinghuangia sp. ASG 101]UGQ11641.1 helix-turn-helix domain-containing protein [Yinghuangia sp. ASG 101]
MLLDGDTYAARRMAEVLTPALAENVRVHVVTPKPGAARQALLSHLRTTCTRSWVALPPSDDELVVVIEPVSDRQVAMSAQVRSHTEVLTQASSGGRVGSSPAVPLSHVASGYADAVHALRTRPTAQERATTADPALLLPPEAWRWVAHLLGPLIHHAPQRTSSPDSPELINTLRVWLDSPRHAGKRLYVHRNTMARRLSRIQDLLHMDLSHLATRAQLAVALALFDRIRPTTAPGPKPATTASFDDLLKSPALRDWAVARLRLLTGIGGAGDPVHTVATWLAHGARPSPTADALGISPTALRKRFIRIETALGSEIFRHPSTQYRWWLAFTAYAPE